MDGVGLFAVMRSLSTACRRNRVNVFSLNLGVNLGHGVGRGLGVGAQDLRNPCRQPVLSFAGTCSILTLSLRHDRLFKSLIHRVGNLLAVHDQDRTDPVGVFLVRGPFRLLEPGLSAHSSS